MNIVTDNMPAITLGFNPTSATIMTEKPRKNAKILTLDFINVILVNGSMMALVTALVAFYSYNIVQFPANVAQSTVLLSLILMHIANAFNFRSFRYRVLNRGLLVNRLLFLASLLSILATIAVLYTPLNQLFDTTPLGVLSWLIAFWAMLVMIFFFDILKTINNKTKLFLEHIH
jgi:Ca2+-transporting ATPase